MVTDVEVVHRDMFLNMYTSIGGVYSPTLAFWAGIRLAKIAALPRIRRTESLVNALLICLSGHPKCHFWAHKDGHFWHFQVSKNCTSGARTKILRPLLYVLLPPKMMESPLVLSIYHFWMGYKPIFEYCHF